MATNKEGSIRGVRNFTSLSKPGFWDEIVLLEGQTNIWMIP
jgi:hypothetical protein